MATILSIETSTNVCSVAVAQDNHVIFHNEDFEGPSHAVQCGLFVQDALSFAESHAIPLDAVGSPKRLKVVEKIIQQRVKDLLS